MTRLNDRFSALLAQGDKALVCYVMAGDPDLPRTLEVLKALDAAGVDAIELGVPFSDPMADGPSIQAAGQRALANNVRVADVFQLVCEFRKTSQLPIVLMSYYNPTLHYGLERFACDAAAAGVDATIQTDLSPEEADEWIGASRAAGLQNVFLVAPTSTPERIQRVCDISNGFVYCVSRTGVTGARADVPADLPELVARVRKQAKAPVCVGFGISAADQVHAITRFADGVVVGSALVNVVAKAGDDLAERVRAFAADLKSGTKEA